ncbi:MAG: SagB/ThcOx family dehydrogenase [Calditrichaeota bacterium]|nr:SagB/ThcOx family dehydrogenase [Calditrichota bacterium]
MSQDKTIIELPAPRIDSDFSVEKAMKSRRSVRDYSDKALSLDELSQLLWACQGISGSVSFQNEGKTVEIALRTAPSAGALYPLEVFAVVSRVEGLEAGIYHYKPGSSEKDHSLVKVKSGDKGYELSKAALGQDCIKNAAVSFVLGAYVERVSVKYGERAEQYSFIEAGHAAQNICLQAQAFEIGTVTVGAFHEDKIAKLLDTDAKAVYMICCGKKK